MTARDIRHPHTGLKALRYNPGLHIIRPAPVTPRSTDDLNLPVETIRNIRHRRLLLLNQDETLSSAVNAKGGYPMGRKRRLLFTSSQATSFISEMLETLASALMDVVAFFMVLLSI
jgi:hypothetical protein